MKRLLPGLCCALLLSAFGPVTIASAHWWSWHHHRKDSASASSSANDSPALAPKPKTKKSWRHHREKAAVTQSGVTTTPGPRTVGWWHKGPGPAGAGAN